MAAPQPSLMECWRAWNAHHRRVLRDYSDEFTNKNVKRRFCKRISLEWKKIGVRYTQAHERRKRQFHQAATSFIRRRAEVAVAQAARNAYIAHNRAINVIPQPEPYEAFLEATIRMLRDLNRVVRIERSAIRQPCDFVRQWDERSVTTMMHGIQRIGLRVARVRTRYEGTVPPNAPGRPLPPNLHTSRTRGQQRQQDRDVDPRPGGLMYHMPIATNPQTSAGLWVLSDAHNTVVDRVVVKDCYFIRNPWGWTHERFWYGDPMDPTTKRPTEAVLHEKVSQQGRQESILDIRSWRLHAHKLMYRLCLEYCPYGDAMELIMRYMRHYRAGAHDAINNMIPEPVIWCAFETLIKAGLVMEQGDADQPPPVWNNGPVLHLDLKPDNLYLGPFPAQNDDWAVYPSFKVADFGHSVDDRRDANYDYRGRGTITYMSPEQLEDNRYHGQYPRDPVNTKTNVWGVGITVMSLMDLGQEPGNLTFEKAATNENHPSLVPQFSPNARAKYSATLRNMVIHCLQYRQVNRPTFRTLRTQLDAVTGLGGPQATDLAQGARFANNLNPTARLRLPRGGDRFWIGRPVGPAWRAV